MENILQIQSKTITYLRFVLAVMIVMIHLPYHPSSGFYYYFWILIQNGVCCVAVPLFALFSGYFFFSGLEDKWDFSLWMEKLKKRIHSLLIPYLIWNLLFAIWILVGMLYQNSNMNIFASWWNEIGGFRIFFAQSSGYPINWALWFIRDLLVCVLFSPVLYLFVKRMGRIGLGLLLIAMILWDQFSLPGFSLSLMFFFSYGAFLRIRHITLVEESQRFKNWALVFSLVLLSLLIPLLKTPYFHYVLNLFTLMGALSLFAVISVLISNEKIHSKSILSKSSFFIYVSHLLVLRIIMKVLKAFIEPAIINSMVGVLYCFITTGLTVGLCVGIYAILSRYLPRLTGVICGGR